MIVLRFSDLRNKHPDWLVRNFACIISWWIGSPWNHVDVLTPHGLFGSMPGDGVVFRHNVIAQAEELVEIEATPAQVETFLGTLYSLTGKGYDYLAAVGFPTGIQDEHTYFCSELVAYALIQAGLYPHSKHASPIDLYNFFKK